MAFWCSCTSWNGWLILKYYVQCWNTEECSNVFLFRGVGWLTSGHYCVHEHGVIIQKRVVRHCGQDTAALEANLSSLVQLAPLLASRNCVSTVFGLAGSFLPFFICIVMGLKVPFHIPLPLAVPSHTPSFCLHKWVALTDKPSWGEQLITAICLCCKIMLGLVWTEHCHRNQVRP